LQLVALGKRPTATHFSYDLFPGPKSTEMKVTEIALPNVSIPRLETIKDLIDFVMMDDYRVPMRRLRSHCAKLLTNTQDIGEISQAIADDMEELDRRIKKEQLKRYFGNCKFIFGTAFGLVEDVLKLRFENLAKRPFEIAESITEQYYYGPERAGSANLNRSISGVSA
jgi:hypothetical protein